VVENLSIETMTSPMDEWCHGFNAGKLCQWFHVCSREL